MRTEGHDMGKDVAGNTPPAAQAPKIDAEHPGYETTDVRTTGILVFLAGLFGATLHLRLRIVPLCHVGFHRSLYT